MLAQVPGYACWCSVGGCARLSGVDALAMEVWVGRQWIYSVVTVWVLDGGREAQARKLGVGQRLGGVELASKGCRDVLACNGAKGLSCSQCMGVCGHGYSAVVT